MWLLFWFSCPVEVFSHRPSVFPNFTKETFNLCRMNEVKWLVLIGCLPLQFEAFVQLVFAVRSSLANFYLNKQHRNVWKKNCSRKPPSYLRPLHGRLDIWPMNTVIHCFSFFSFFLHDTLIRDTNLTECLLFLWWHLFSFQILIWRTF